MIAVLPIHLLQIELSLPHHHLLRIDHELGIGILHIREGDRIPVGAILLRTGILCQQIHGDHKKLLCALRRLYGNPRGIAPGKFAYYSSTFRIRRIRIVATCPRVAFPWGWR